jgi:hypothetical protein
MMRAVSAESSGSSHHTDHHCGTPYAPCYVVVAHGRASSLSTFLSSIKEKKTRVNNHLNLILSIRSKGERLEQNIFVNTKNRTKEMTLLSRLVFLQLT